MTDATSPPGPSARLELALDEAFARETRRGVLLMAIYQFVLSGFNAAVRLADILARIKTPWQWAQDVTLAMNLAIAITAVAVYVLALRSRRPLVYAYLLVLMAAISQGQTTFFFLFKPASIAFWPTYLSVRFQDVQGVAVLLASCSLPLSRLLALRTGVAAAVVWPAAVIVAFVTYPGSALYLGGLGPGLGEAGLTRISNPFVLVPDYLAIQVLLLVAFAALLAGTVEQSHRYVVSRVRTEVDLAFLRRLLPPDLAERAARTGDGRLHPVRRQVAVLFVGRQEGEDGPTDLGTLRAYYAEVERAAFSHGGMIDRFNGGPIMIAFGALEPAPDAARRALDCTRALSGGPAPGGRPLSMAAHFGDAVCGEAGGAQSRVFSVVGDVVNTARRVLDQAAPGDVLATEELVQALGGADKDGLSPLGETALRGRDGKVMLWSLA